MSRVTLSELDARIGELRSTVERITANLATLDDDLTRQVLDASTSLRGRTLESWTVARGGIEQLWQGQLALHDLLERLDTARGTRTTVSRVQAQAVAELLEGPSVVLVTGSSRSLTEEPEVTVRVTTAEVVSAMSTTYDGIVEVVDRVATVWSTTGPALAELDVEVRRLEEVAAGFGRIGPERTRPGPPDTPGGRGADALRPGRRRRRHGAVDPADGGALRRAPGRVGGRPSRARRRPDGHPELDRPVCRPAAEARAVCAEVAPKVAGSERWDDDLDRRATGIDALRAELDDPGVAASTPVAVRHQLAGVRRRAGELEDEVADIVRTACGPRGPPGRAAGPTRRLPGQGRRTGAGRGPGPR